MSKENSRKSWKLCFMRLQIVSKRKKNCRKLQSRWFIQIVSFLQDIFAWWSFILNKIAILVTINYHSMCNDLEPDARRICEALKLFPLHKNLIYPPTLHRKSKSLLTLSGDRFSFAWKLFPSFFVALESSRKSLFN